MIPGCDVASFQGVPRDWQGAAGAIGFAAVKFTELQPGGIAYVNPDAAADWAWLRDHGKGRVAYLFGHPSVNMAATADLLVGELRRLGLEDGDGVALDLEVTDGLPAAAVNLWALDVLRLLERGLERTPLLYTFLSFAWAGNCASLGGYPLWISDPSSPKGEPRVPDPWKDWAVHQYATSGAIDRDAARWPDLAEMKAALGKHTAAPHLPEHVRAHHWHTLGFWSLDREAREHGTSPAEMLELAKAAGHRYGPAMTAYAERRDFAARLPAGTLLYAPGR